MPHNDGFTKYEERNTRRKPTRTEKLKRRRRLNDPKREARRGVQKSRREKLKQRRRRLNAADSAEAMRIREEGR